MHFAYEGFTQEGDKRCFLFRGTKVGDSTDIFSIEVDLRLLAQNQVLVQEGPIFCLNLLTTALVGGPDYLQQFHAYRVVGEDFRQLQIERARRAAERAPRKPPRRPIRKPPAASNVWLSTSSKGDTNMSFAECGARAFTAISVRKNAPESSGVYGLSNSREWLFIGEARDIRARLLEHLQETNTMLANGGPTGFTFEECPAGNRFARQGALVRQFNPCCNRRSG